MLAFGDGVNTVWFGQGRPDREDQLSTAWVLQLNTVPLAQAVEVPGESTALSQSEFSNDQSSRLLEPCAALILITSNY